MSKTHIALSRFGYGLRLGESVPADPERYLLGQMDAFDPAPAPIRDRGVNLQKPGEILEMIRSNRRQRQMQEAEVGAEMDAMELADPVSNPRNGLRRERARSYRAAGQILLSDVALRTNVAARSSTPMMERLVHFWSNHFSVSAQKAGTHYQVADHEFRAIRPNVLGNFSDMLKAAVLHPAMLMYLDQYRSVGPNSPSQQRRRQRRPDGRERGLNENLAREILELHTLGVAGGYSQTDVTEFARALTGWTIQGLRQVDRHGAPAANGAAFVPLAHEPGSRRVIGRTYPDNGAHQAEAILNDLANHPSTARFIATKLARHFAGDAPPPSLVGALEEDFLRSDGDLARLTRTLIAAPETWVEGSVKYRQPFEWFVAVMRLTDIDGLSDRRLTRLLRELGQVPWRAPSPAGYDDLEGSWAGSDALFRRVELAERIARNAPTDGILEYAETAFPGALSDHTRTWLSRAESGAQALGLLLISPEMLRR